MFRFITFILLVVTTVGCESPTENANPSANDQIVVKGDFEDLFDLFGVPDSIRYKHGLKSVITLPSGEVLVGEEVHSSQSSMITVWILTSTNHPQWKRVEFGEGSVVNSFAVPEEGVYAATDGGLYKSSDGGSSWSLNRSGRTSDVLFSLRENEIFLALYGDGVVRSSNGTDWRPVNNGLRSRFGADTSFEVNQLVESASGIMAAGFDRVYKLDSENEVWISQERINYNLRLPGGICIPVIGNGFGNQIYVWAGWGYFAWSIDGGINWQENLNCPVRDLDNYSPSLAINSSGTVFLGGFSPESALYLSRDNGISWLPIEKETWWLNKGGIKDLTFDKENRLLVVTAGSVFRSRNPI